MSDRDMEDDDEMIKCPWCEKKLNEAWRAFSHCNDQGHEVRGQRYRIELMAPGVVRYVCVCGYKAPDMGVLIAHFGDCGGFEQHTLHVMVGADG